MIVSKPCNHPECPPRQGIIRGQYESVELIREIAAENLASKRSLSSADLMTDKNMAPAVSKAGSNRGDGPPIAIEWLMVTRSDPGGSVPRFMIEKGTPPGIVNDAGKFLNWVTRNSTDDSNSQEGEGTTQEKGASSGPVSGVKTPAIAKHPADGVEPSHPGHHIHQDSNASEDGAWSSNGLYGMITGALGAATSVVSGGLLRQFGALEDHASDNSPAEEAEGETSSSDTSSIRSFASALERSLTHGKGLENDKGSDGVPGSHSEGKSQGNQPQHKELRRLEERRRKLDEKTLKMTERIEKQRQGDKEKDAASLAKVREKHEKEIAKHEAKYKRELRRIEEKREQEERKAEERKKKAAEREERSNLSLEIEKVRVERDVALKQAELLKSQVGELQAQNTMLAAKMGKLSDVERRDSGSTTSSKTRKHSQGMSPKISPG